MGRREDAGRRTSRPGASLWRREHALPLALVAAVVLAAPAARAASRTDWSFEVLDVTREDDGQLLRLRPSPPGQDFPRSCGALVVHARYDLSSWSEAQRRSLSRNVHEKSILVLEQAKAVGRIVRFGAIGRGFGHPADSPACEVESRGLLHVVDSDGRSVVYSVFEEP